MNSKSKQNESSNDVRLTYSNYLIYAETFDIHPFLTKDEFNDVLGYDEKSDIPDDVVRKLGFTPAYITNPGTGYSPWQPRGSMPTSKPIGDPLQPIPPGGGGSLLSGLRGFSEPIGKVIGMYETLADPEIPPIDKIKTVVRVVDSVTKGGGNQGNIKRGDVPAGSATPSSNSVLAINTKPNAIEVQYEPAIPHTLFSNYYRTSLPKDSNLYVTQTTLKLPQQDPEVRNYIQNILIPDLQTRANISVNFNVNATSVFTFNKVMTYMDTVIKAMCVYYSYSNILAYCSETTNNNTGMYTLRSMITPDDIQSLYLLSERLNNIPIPPRLRELCYWLSNIYKATKDTPNTPILFNTPLRLIGNLDNVDGDGFGYQTQIQSVIPDLISDLNPTATSSAGFDGNMINMLAKVCPGWLGTPMGSAPGVPLFDNNYLDFWSNSPCAIETADLANVSVQVPNLADDNRATPIEYVAFSNELSGVSQALFSVRSFGASNSWSGLVLPDTSITRNVISATNYGGTSNRFVFATTTSEPDGRFYPYYGCRENQLFYGPNALPYGGDYPKSQSMWFNNPGYGSDSSATNRQYVPATAQSMFGMNLSSNAMPALQSTRWLMSFDEAFSSSPTKPTRSRSRKRGNVSDRNSDDKE